MAEKTKTTPLAAKDFFLWTGAIISLYGSVIAFIGLFFSYIDYVFPDVLNSYASDPYQSGVSYQMATLIVAVPLFFVLMHFIRRGIAKEPARGELWVRRWALYLTLFLAGATFAIDLIVLLTTFFRGDELTLSFLLKVAIVLLVTAGGFMHFLADLWGYWAKFPARVRSVGYTTGFLVLATIAVGFFVIGTPWQAREYRLDEAKVADLQNIQAQIVEYWQQKQALPGTLSDLDDSISGFSVPVDSQTGQAYTYVVASTTVPAFQLCATFNAPSTGAQSDMAEVMPAPYSADTAQDSWAHGAGQTCFARTIDPARYPAAVPAAPITK